MLQVPFSHFACYNLTIFAYFCENGRRFIVIQYYMGLGKSDYVIYGWGRGSGILLLGLYMNISNFIYELQVTLALLEYGATPSGLQPTASSQQPMVARGMPTLVEMI